MDWQLQRNCTMQQLIQDVTEYLDVDPRFWNATEGEFEYDGETVFFRKLSDSILLFVDGVVLEAPRH
jgi:cytochrome oxidase assembly protein ShyY1